MTKLRRGFIKEAEEYAEEFRLEMGLSKVAPIFAENLAEHLGVPVLKLSTHPKISDEVKEFWANNEEDVFSALTMPDGAYREILHNDGHHPNRQNSNIAHELAHIILGHSMTAPISDKGKRNYDKEIEEEAKVLSMTLLIPKVVAVCIVEQGLNLDQASLHYRVSKPLLNYRIGKTDARNKVYYSRMKRRGF
ncbi:MAG: ImmA/IrrE family metallo-endopeptidase [Amylibacter sp.]|nr:ImmA/IrrE family metallo-endopeptidase [Amylibacter sp.]